MVPCRRKWASQRKGAEEPIRRVNQWYRKCKYSKYMYKIGNVYIIYIKYIYYI